MKYKKYLLFLLVIMVIGVNRTYAMNINYSQNSLINILEVGCNDLFDQSLIDLLNDILKYPRIIVPILVIGLGLIDLGKAVMASKEDEIKSANRNRRYTGEVGDVEEMNKFIDQRKALDRIYEKIFSEEF